MACSIAAASRTFICTGVTPNDGAMAWNERQRLSAQGAVLLLYSRATRASVGANCLNRDSHFQPMSYSKVVNPVTLPPGLAWLRTTPLPTGSGTDENHRDRTGRLPHQLRGERVPRHDHIGIEANHLLHISPE